MNDKETREERTEWRDSAFSSRHRKYGYVTPMVDIDFLCCEYAHSEPVALIEYKNEHSATKNKINDSTIKCVETLANNSKIPFFIVVYSSDEKENDKYIFVEWFKIRPINQYAISFLKEIGYPPLREIKEIRYVQFLYKLRGKKMPDDISKQLRNVRNKFETTL